MPRQNLMGAHEQLFRRDPDECAADLPALREHCRKQKEDGRAVECSPFFGPGVMGVHQVKMTLL